MKAKDLAIALHEILATKGVKESKAIVESFLSYIERNGYRKLLPAVLREFETYEGAEAKEAILTVAEAGHAKKVSDANGAKVVVDPRIIGGYTLETESSFIDASQKGALIKLYQSLTR